MPMRLEPELSDDAMPDASEAMPTPAADHIYRQRFSVSYDYPVIFTRDLFAPANPALRDALGPGEQAHKLVVFVDQGVAAAQADLPARIAAYASASAGRIDLITPAEIIPGGEACKNDPALVERLQRRLLDLGMDRHGFVAAVGGGAFLDLIGYVAATLHRGIRHIRVPTTVLAQNDSGVGVKNGVNAFGQKNLLGTFVPPFAVLNDSRFLDLLDIRDRRAGMAEAVKVALIRDAAFFAWLEHHGEDLAAFRPSAVDRLIRRCAELHMIQIASGGDPFERGSARPLDFGHWAAHKIEMLSDHALRHGEAVAIGIALDTHYSVLSGLLPSGEDDRVCALLTKLGLPLYHPVLSTRDSSGDLGVLRGLRDFREHLGGQLTITLLRAIGTGIEVHEMDERLIVETVGWLKDKAAA